MLNLSPNRIDGKIETNKYRSFSIVKDYKSGKILARLLIISLLTFIVVLFFPWTQNIQVRGYVTTLQPD